MLTYICINVESPNTPQQHKFVGSYTQIRKVSCIYCSHTHERAHSQPKVSTVALPQKEKTDSNDAQYWQYTQQTVASVAECLKFPLGVLILSTILHKLEGNIQWPTAHFVCPFIKKETCHIFYKYFIFK